MDGEVPRSTSYGVYISQLIRFTGLSSHVTDFNGCDKISTATFHQQDYWWYHKLRKVLIIYRLHYESISIFKVGLKTLCNKAYRNQNYMTT